VAALVRPAVEKDSAHSASSGPGEALTTKGRRETLTPAYGSRGPRETLTSFCVGFSSIPRIPPSETGSTSSYRVDRSVRRLYNELAVYRERVMLRRGAAVVVAGVVLGVGTCSHRHGVQRWLRQLSP
jgi:hypothetical protein